MFDHGEGVVGVERFTGRFKGSQIARIVSSFVSFIRFETDRIDGYRKTLMIHRIIGFSVIRWWSRKLTIHRIIGFDFDAKFKLALVGNLHVDLFPSIQIFWFCERHYLNSMFALCQIINNSFILINNLFIYYCLSVIYRINKYFRCSQKLSSNLILAQLNLGQKSRWKYIGDFAKKLMLQSGPWTHKLKRIRLLSVPWEAWAVREKNWIALPKTSNARVRPAGRYRPPLFSFERTPPILEWFVSPKLRVLGHIGKWTRSKIGKFFQKSKLG